MMLMLLQAAAAAAEVWSPEERAAAMTRPIAGLVIAWLVVRFARRHPWPRPFRLRFALLHVVGAPVAATAWYVVGSLLQALVLGRGPVMSVYDSSESVVIGSFLYVLVAGLTYAVEGSARAARAEALAARTQLAALRAQVHPHFLFNALHTVVQLIPVDPKRAAEAAELVADLLRTTLEQQRDEVTLGDEWDFVRRYLEMERIRFGDRLVVRADIDDALLDEPVPAFALQTLVENAVRHGAAHRVEPTEVAVTASRSASALTLTVHNAVDTTAAGRGNGAGTGLPRLRDRLAVLHGGAARLATDAADGSFEAVLTLPRRAVARP